MVDNIPNYSMKNTFFEISQGIGSAMLEGVQECVPTIVSEASKNYFGFDPFLNSPPSMGTIMENQISGGSKKRSNRKQYSKKKKRYSKKRHSKKNNKRRK
tara:strand:- start:94 stop:393 length:300 start_codon:yes stop_codon:yes gene_type:complete